MGLYKYVLKSHDLFMGFKYIFIEPPVLCGFFLTATMYAFWIPGLTIALKLPLLIPPIDWYLTKIRGGWTRNQKSSDSSEIFVKKMLVYEMNNTLEQILQILD